MPVVQTQNGRTWSAYADDTGAHIATRATEVEAQDDYTAWLNTVNPVPAQAVKRKRGRPKKKAPTEPPDIVCTRKG